MDRFLAVFRHVQSNPESLMNGICGLLALASVRLYSTFHFSCPCHLLHPIFVFYYNTLYGLAVLLLLAFCFLLCGVLLNRRWVLVLQEWRRPVGGRSKDGPALRYLLLTVLQGATLAPATWLLVALLDAKCTVCAFATCVEPGRFANVSGYPEPELRSALARVPCKDLGAAPQLPFPGKAIYRYLLTVSQALGWCFLLMMTFLAFLVRATRPCFTQVAFLKTRYWSHYIDIERKLFEETCREHARSFSKICVQQFFEEMQDEMTKGCGSYHPPTCSTELEPEAKLFGITDSKNMNNLLRNWHNCKPPRDVSSVPSECTQQQVGSAKLNWSEVRWQKVAFYSRV